MCDIGETRPYFIDLFAGCGGLSLGLLNSNWKGVFAIEKNPDAFNTLEVNLLSSNSNNFIWPTWLPKESIDIIEFVDEYKTNLEELSGKITLIAGGPPCQGFSLAGRRTHADPRNTLVNEYIKIVRILNPRFLLIENVEGFTLPFKKNGNNRSKEIPYSTLVKEQLEELNYKVFSNMVDMSKYGVPQIRKRFILIAIKNEDKALLKLGNKTPFDILEDSRESFLKSKGLGFHIPTAKEAIGDLETFGKKLVKNDDSPNKGFMRIEYELDESQSSFISLMREGFKNVPTSMRLPNHKDSTKKVFAKIINSCTPGKVLSKEDRLRLGIKKHAITLLSPEKPSSTVTTLPDDIIHYSEPRILTVRENARLQTFPDWFEFTGNYTTGGAERKNSCPRYTQVGNAVPPLFSEAIGTVLRDLAN